jgi:hypothetical protein
MDTLICAKTVFPHIGDPMAKKYPKDSPARVNGKWSPLYVRFMNLKSRCLRPSDPDYPRYGGRGITVCDRWRYGEEGKTGFECFFEDMGYPPFEKATIDRINSAGPYSPENCRWASLVDQGNNRITNRIVEIHGQVRTISQWARISGVGPKTIRYRLGRGVPPEQAVFEKPSRRRHFKAQ